MTILIGHSRSKGNFSFSIHVYFLDNTEKPHITIEL